VISCILQAEHLTAGDVSNYWGGSYGTILGAYLVNMYVLFRYRAIAFDKCQAPRPSETGDHRWQVLCFGWLRYISILLTINLPSGVINPVLWAGMLVLAVPGIRLR
jgi:hypothetical protein